MKNDFVIAIAQLSAEKNLDAETVYAAVESALASAYKKDDLEYADVVVSVDRATGDEHVKRRYLIMDDDDIEDDEIQMSPERAKQLGLSPNPVVGEYVTEDLPENPNAGSPTDVPRPIDTTCAVPMPTSAALVPFAASL